MIGEAATILYLEADDEITSVVRRVRAAASGGVVVVAPGRSRATSSVVALRLIRRAADAEGRSVAIVGDALTRSLAAEAGLQAFATLDEARRADGDAPVAEARHASIAVVRGSASAASAPTLAAAPIRATADDVTRPVAVARARGRPKPAVRHATRRRAPPPAAVLAAIAALLVAGVVAAVVVLPAATITLVAQTAAIGPVEYEIAVDDPEHLTGTVTARTEVAATGTYQVLEPASGTVVLLNWTNEAVRVPAGTFVAAGEQAFATQAEVVVPRGTLTAEGTIAAGEMEVAVVAAEPGPAANVAAGAIDAVVNESIDAQLQGFAENAQRRVTNPAATSGGVDASGVEVTEEDVDAAVASLVDDLEARVADALPDDGLVVTPDAVAEPTVDGIDGLAGTRDPEAIEIEGSLGWEAYRVDEAAVVEAARERLMAAADLLPEGHELLPDSVEVSVGPASVTRDRVTVDTTVAAESAPSFDPAEIGPQVAGRSAESAAAALDGIGAAAVELWPPWVDTVPTLDWRIDVRVTQPTAGDAPVPSDGSASPRASDDSS